MRAGRFREDLYYRLCVIPLLIPPLRERSADIPLLSKSILDAIAKRRGGPVCRPTPEAMRLLEAHPWPGNVRQLENTLERASAFCAEARITPADLPADITAPADPVAGAGPTLAGMTLDRIEKLALTQTLDATAGNRAKAARILGVSEKTVYNLLHRHGLAAPHGGLQV